MTPELKTVMKVNPHREVVDLRPQELLEVVFVNNKSVKWFNAFAAPRPQLKALRQETFHTDGFKRPKRVNFKIRQVARHLNVWQHHFWFRFNPLDIGKLEHLRFPYDLAQLSFSTEAGERIGDLMVRLVFDEKDKEEYFNLLSQTTFRNIDPIKKEAEYVGVGGRVVTLDEGYLFNPTSEQVVFDRTDKLMLVEFPEPTYNKGDTYEWKATVAPNNVWYDFDVSELPTRKINGRKIQRFMLKNLSSDLGPGVTSKRLGKVLFVVENENRTRYMKFDRTLDVVLTHHRELGQEFYQGDSGDESNHEVLEREEEEFGKTLFLSEVVKEIERRRKPEKSKVTFEEIDSGLEVGVKTWKLCEIGRCGKRHEIFNPKDLDSISISNDTDLVIVLPFTNEKRWGVEIKGRWLRIDYTLVDGNRQRFTFNPKPKDEHRQDTDEIIFRCAGQEKRVFVRKYIPMVWSDCDRYPD